MLFRPLNEEESSRFDSFVRDAEYGDITQTFAWGEIKKDWEPHRYVVEDETGAIVAAVSLLCRRLPFLAKTVAYAPRGPVLSNPDNLHLFRSTMEYLEKEARRHNAIVLKVDPTLPDGHQAASTLKELGFHLAGQEYEFGGLQPRYTFRLSLEGTPDEIFSRFPKKLRYKINYGPKNGLSFRANENTSIDDFYAALSETGERNQFLTRSPEYFRHVYNTLKKEDRILLLTGYVEDKPVISSLTLCLGDKSWAVYGGQTGSHRNLYTYHAMNWERIVWAHGQGARWFDFYGVPGHVGEDHPLYGLYHFKKSFGGDFVAFIGEWDLPLSKPFYSLWEKGLPRYRNILHRITGRSKKK